MLLLSFQLPHSLDNGLFAGFLQLSSKYELVQNKVDLLKIENQIQLTYIAEEMVKNLHKQVDTFKVHELIVSNVNTQGEEETRISPVYYFVCPKLDKVCELGISVDHQAMHLKFKLMLLGVLKRNVIFGKTSFPLPILQQDESNHVEEAARRCVYFASLLMLRVCSSFLNGAVCLCSLLAPLSFLQQKTDKEK